MKRNPVTLKVFRKACISLAVLIQCLVQCSRLQAAEEPYTNYIDGALIAAGNHFYVTDEKFLDLTAWNKINPSLSAIPENIVELKFDYFKNIFFYNQQFSVNVNVTIQCFNNPYDTSQIFQQYDNVTLTIRYDSTTGLPYKGVHFLKFKGAYKFRVIVNSISSPELGTNIPLVVRLEGKTIIKRKYNFVAASPDITKITAETNRVLLSWQPSNYEGAELFDLEYTVIDDSSAYGSQIRQAMATSTALTPQQLTDFFRNNCTRITTPKDSFSINQVYKGGLLLFRIRGVQFKNEYLTTLSPAEINFRTQGDWNYTAVKTDNPSYVYNVIQLDWHEPLLNWQYSISFAEEGKKKEMIGYFDGLFKNRQNVTINNASANAIVQETFYDAQGRPAVNILPAPSNDGSLHYYDSFNKDNQDLPYSYLDISNGAGCTDTAAPVSSLSGAGRYYSSQNDINDYFFKKYIPESQGYPFAYTVYTPDNTGRILSQGGVGKELQPGKGHETKYFYGKPTQSEIDRLFGTEAGNASHYLKNMVVDPNGQISVSYVNAGGKTVATALAGITPDGLETLSSNDNVGIVERKNIIADQDFNEQTSSGLKIGKTSFLAPVSGEYKFYYSLTPLRMDVLYGPTLQYKLCNTCYYDLEILVKDNCGILKGSFIQPLPTNTVFSTDCGYTAPVISDSFSVTLGGHEIGDYNVSYEIKVSESALRFYDSVHFAQNTDLRTLNNFFLDKLKQANFLDCFSDCSTCLTTLGTKTEFVDNRIKPLFISADSLAFTTEYLTWANLLYDSLLAECSARQSGCNPSSPCDEEKLLLMQDLTPGGQYALYDENYNLLETSTLNVLAARSSIDFYDEDGITPSVIYYNGVSYLPRNPLVPDSIFIQAFQPSWAEAFLPLHPEYCMYQWCIANSTSKAFDNKVLELDDEATAVTNGYFGLGSVTALLDNDPFFASGGNGAAFYSAMSDSLYFYSQTVYGYPSSASVRNILSYIDYELYCEPELVSPASCTPPLSSCRSPYMEWQMYKEAYLRLKSYFFVKARLTNPTFSECKNCYIGTDNTESFKCTPEPVNTFTVTYLGVSGADRLIKISYNNAGDTTVPFSYVLTIGYVQSGLTYYVDRIITAGYSNITVTVPASTGDSYIIYGVTCDQGGGLGSRPVKTNQDYWANLKSNALQPSNLLVNHGGLQSFSSPLFRNKQNPGTGCPCPDASMFYSYINMYSYDCGGYGSSIIVQYYGDPIPTGRSVEVFYEYYDYYMGYLGGSIMFYPGEYYKEICLYFYAYPYFDPYISSVYCYDDVTFHCPSDEIPVVSLCTDDPRYPLFKDKIRRYNDYQDTRSLTEEIASRVSQLSTEKQNELNENCKENCEAQADVWINSLKGCAGTPLQLATLRASLISICQAGCSSSALGGTSNGQGQPYDFEAAIRSVFPTATDSCTAELISNPYPWKKEPVYERNTYIYIQPCLQTRFTALKNQYLSSGFSGTFHQWLQKQLKGDYKLTSTELASLETQLASGCRYLKKPLELPVAMNCDPNENNVAGCVDSSAMVTLLSNFATKYPGLDSTNINYEFLLTNYLNHQLAFSLNFEDYQEYIHKMNAGTLNKDLLCARSQSSYLDEVSSVNNCMSDVFLVAYSEALGEYTAYVDSVRAAFRSAYFAKCLSGPSFMDMKSNYLEYHYTLYYYDQSGNLVKTIPPKGVIVGNAAQIAQTGQNRVNSNKYCFDNQPYAGFTGTNLIAVAPALPYFEYGESQTASLEAFVRLNNFSDQGILSFNDSHSDGVENIENGCALFIRSNKLIVRSGLGISYSVMSERETPVLSGIISTGQWFHIALVYNVYASPVSLYINGVVVPLTALDVNNPFFYPDDPTFPTPIRLGGAFYNGTTGFLQGDIRQFRMYKRSLSQPEIIANANNKCLLPFSTVALCAHIPLYEGIGVPKDYQTGYTGIASSGSIPWVNYFPPYYPAHTFATLYEYNSFNQVVKQQTPDADSSRFWYDALGRLVASQNEEQRNPKNTYSNASTNRYSYTKYDAQGRIIEVGEKRDGGLVFNETSSLGYNVKEPYILSNWYGTGTDYEVTESYYDAPNTTVVPHTAITDLQVLNSRKRVVTTLYKEIKTNAYYNQATHFVYDINGNVKTQFEEVRSFMLDLPVALRYPRRIDYDYDLVSGKVNKVLYEQGKGDQFYHKYEYDPENRITGVFSSRDDLRWENEARYYYYLHGPLARTELGERKVQGVDYAYTLQGWLKGINGQLLDPSKDMAGDGLTSNLLFKNMSRDVYGFSLGYYNNDYQPIGGLTAAPAFDFSFTAPTGQVGVTDNTGYELFNGNIRNTTIALNRIGGGVTMGYSYLYDQLNRLAATKQHDISSGSWSYGTYNDAYRERVSYDPNGNIQSYLRKAADGTGAAKEMDNLTYNYLAGTNKLNYVGDIVNDGNFGVDVDLKNQSANNYDYDRTGNLISDVKSDLTHVNWNLYGKIRSLNKTDGTEVVYGYNSSGNRVEKTVTKGSVTNRYIYIRDAQGNVLSVYRDSSTIVNLEEQHLYGSARLGMLKYGSELPVDPISSGLVEDSSLIGSKQYELTNHLSNVLSVVSDKKTGVEGSTPGLVDYYKASVLSQQDYYPFGMIQPGRAFNLSSYRYGFNGQEKSDEIKGDGNSYTAAFWEYDPRIGRRWNLDQKYFSGESRYAVNGNNPIIYLDPNGDFRSRFGAWLYKIGHGGRVGKDTKTGQFYVGKQVDYTGEGSGGSVRRTFDWNGGVRPYTGSGWGHTERSALANIFGVDGKASNLFDLGWNSVLQNKSVQLTGGLLERIKQDPAVQGLENDIVRKVQGQSQYSKEAFTYSLPNNPVQLGGQRGSLNPLDASSIDTWKVGTNPLTWAVRSVNIQAQVKVSAEGCMSISYNFTDNFDLRPERGGKVYFGGSGNSPFSSEGGSRPWQYNTATSVLGVPYHDVIGANDQLKITATWTSER